MATKATKEGAKKEKDGVKIIKTPVDLQRLKLEKLMKNPTKEIVIPEKSKEKSLRAPLEFIRNIWGSSAGAGSGDFHVYRGVRRREYARQKFIKEMSEKEEADAAYKKSLDQHKLEAEQRTAKKRAKRLKKKQKLKAKKMKKKSGSAANDKTESDSDGESSDAESGDDSQADRSDEAGNDKERHAQVLPGKGGNASPSQDDEPSREQPPVHSANASADENESEREDCEQTS